MDFRFLKEMVNVPSPSGFEDEASALWKKHVEAHIDLTPHVDTYGNVIATINPSGNPRVMLCGHIDEVGFMVKYVNDDGFIYFSEIGSVDPLVAIASRVVIHTEHGPVCGVIGRKPTHLQEDGDDDEEAQPKLHDLYIDIGTVDKSEALDIVRVGDPITFDMDCREMGEDYLTGRGLDNKLGAWCVAEAMVRLSSSSLLKSKVYGVATIQEENGFYGAIMSAFNLKPDVALAIDVTHSTDLPELDKEKHGDISLGNGPVILVGSVVNKKLKDSLIAVANKHRIPFQLEAAPIWSGTDVDGIFASRGGIASGIICIPARYMHTPVEMVHKSDIKNAVKLLVKWCEELDDKLIQ